MPLCNAILQNISHVTKSSHVCLLDNAIEIKREASADEEPPASQLDATDCGMVKQEVTDEAAFFAPEVSPRSDLQIASQNTAGTAYTVLLVPTDAE